MIINVYLLENIYDNFISLSIQSCPHSHKCFFIELLSFSSQYTYLEMDPVLYNRKKKL